MQNEADALTDPWTILTTASESADSIGVVADAYPRRTGKQQERTGSIEE